METKTKKIHYAWWILVVCFLMNLTVHALNFQVLGLFTKPVSEYFQVGRSVYSLQNVACTLSAVIAAPMWGKLYRKYDMRKLLAFCTLMTALCVFGTSLAPNIYVVILLGLFRGIFLTGNTVLPNSILLTQWFDKKRGFALSTASIGISVGSSLFNPIIQSIITNSGWQYANGAMALIIAIMAPLTYLIVRATPKDKNLQPFGYDSSSPAEVQKEKEEEKSGMTLKEARKTPIFYLFLFVVFSVTFTTGAWLQLSPYLTDIGYDAAFAAKMLSFFYLASIFGKLLMGHLFDKLKLPVSSSMICISGILTFVCLIFAKNTILLICALLLWAFCNGITSIMTPLWTSTIFGTKDYASIYGWVLAVNRFGGVIGNFLVSFLYDLNQNNDLIWPICVVIMTFSLIAILICLKKAEKYKKVNG